MSFPSNRLEHERPVHEDPVKVYRAGDQTAVERQSRVLLIEGEVALGRVQGKAWWQGGKVVVDVSVDCQYLLIHSVAVVVHYLSSRASVLVR